MFNPAAMDHPYAARVTPDGRSKISREYKVVKPYIEDFFPEFGKAMESRYNESPADRVRGHQMLRTAVAAAKTARAAGESYYISRAGPGADASELDNTTIKSNIANFVTQEVHRSLDVWMRMISTRLVSVQPLTQQQGYFFFDKHTGHPNTVNEFDLNDIDAFDQTFGDLDEGGPVDAVGIGLTSQTVAVKWKALKAALTHQMLNKLMTEHGLDGRDWGDNTSAHMLAWLTDRDVMSALETFAETNPRGIKYWDPTKGGTYDALTPSEQHAYDKSFIRNIITVVATEMYADRFVSPSFYVAGTNGVQLLARTPEFVADKMTGPAYDQQIAQGSLITSGRMEHGEVVYHDPMMNPDRILVGHTNPLNPFWAGFIFGNLGSASLATSWFMNPDTLVDKRARAVAYAFLGVRAKQYRIIELDAEPT